jgi:BlaI family transcriptional regulator, penicillinase repressor
MLNILQRKGKVKRKLLGKAYEYRPVLSRDKALSEAASDMLKRMFGGSVEALLMSLLKSNQLDADKLARVQKLIESQQQADREEYRGRE